MKQSSILTLLAASCLALPLAAQQPAAAAASSTAPIVAELEDCLSTLERVVLPALRSARDEATADAAALQLAQASPQLHRLAHYLMEDLSLEEQKVVLPMLAPRMPLLLSQMDSCCSMAAELLCLKPAALGSESFACALTEMLDSLMGVPAGAPTGRTAPADVPLALAEADAQLASASSLLASLERLQDRDAVERELPCIREQLGELRSLQRALADTQRWSKTQLFLIMQRTRVRGRDIITDLGKCTGRLMGLTPPCYGSAELEALLTELIQQR